MDNAMREGVSIVVVVVWWRTAGNAMRAGLPDKSM